ncbi:hypothetical protein [Achromobacter sp. UMC46]|uniref:hypothetical protein n=1 Tax=Achromobacter sp. UMC46 TaxID=1862319 RepID=UPI001603DEAF|nr:hypothetical protein [Achromobacter sp. UMC46]MBB1594174.1 hypothetical protein [Achromobacter sp. UMC46]
MEKKQLAVKISGFGSIERLDEFAASQLVNVGGVSHAGNGFAVISPENDVEVESVEDFAWFRGVVETALALAGFSEAIVQPESVDWSKEKCEPVSDAFWIRAFELKSSDRTR